MRRFPEGCHHSKPYGGASNSATVSTGCMPPTWSTATSSRQTDSSTPARPPLLGDLGMAAAMGPDGSAPPYGTFATVAPEVLGTSGRCSVRSDVYSLGATVFYLATGEYPVSHMQTRAAMAAQIVAGQRRRLRDLAPHVSISLGRVVERALSTDPADRQPDGLTLANQLSGCSYHRRTWWSSRGTSRSPYVLSG